MLWHPHTVPSFRTTANRRWAYATNGFRSLLPPDLPTQIPDEPEDYQKTIIGVPDRNNIWIMSRNPQMSVAEYQRMLSYAASIGYDVAKVKRVPQRWPSE